MEFELNCGPLLKITVQEPADDRAAEVQNGQPSKDVIRQFAVLTFDEMATAIERAKTAEEALAEAMAKLLGA